jgi:hypothetical protein
MQWPNGPDLAETRLEASQWLTTLAAPIIVKDPRLCITLPMWREVVEEDLIALFVLRDPLEVALSLHRRDGIPVTLGLALWQRDIRLACHGLRGIATLVLEYGAMVRDPATTVRSVVSFLEGQGIVVTPDAIERAASSVNPELRHHTGDIATPYDGLLSECHDLLSDLLKRAGPHISWDLPVLPDEPRWVDDVIQLRQEAAQLQRQAWEAQHELYWIKRSRSYRLASSIWQRRGRQLEPFLEGPDHLR